MEEVLVGGKNGRLPSPKGAIELTGDLPPRHLITTDNSGVPEGEGRGEDEGQAQHQGDGRQASVGDSLGRSGSRGSPGTMFTSTQESMLQGPIWGAIVPPLFSTFQRAWPRRRTWGAEKAGASKVLIQSHSWEVVGAWGRPRR